MSRTLFEKRCDFLRGLGYGERMSKFKVSVLGFLMGATALAAQEMSYKACYPGQLGCYVGKYSAGAGFGWSRFRSQTSFWPHFQLEIGLLNSLSLEFTAGGIDSKQFYQSLSAAPSLIVGAGLQFYPAGLYRGLVWRGATMAHLYKDETANHRYSKEMALLSTLGWRWRPKEHAGSFTLAAGAQKVLSGNGSVEPVVESQIAIDFNLDSIFF